MEEIDAGLAEIWKVVEEKGLADNTIFFFSSDNGPWIYYPERMAGDGFTRPWHVGFAGNFSGVPKDRVTRADIVCLSSSTGKTRSVEAEPSPT